MVKYFLNLGRVLPWFLSFIDDQSKLFKVTKITNVITCGGTLSDHSLESVMCNISDCCIRLALEALVAAYPLVLYVDVCMGRRRGEEKKFRAA